MDISTLRHSCSHVMAEAVKKLWPETKLAIGPSIEDGFYYDFDKKDPLSNEDLLSIEQEMQKIISRDEPFLRQELNRPEAIELFEKTGEDYKVELIKNLPN
ncbi:MAG: threonine--tRNA ligase, partial [Candidatus Omnitrophica bacterium]|nr:threonine--tRNA ligase [Candidatus Omnitrophota bacterium]